MRNGSERRTGRPTAIAGPLSPHSDTGARRMKLRSLPWGTLAQERSVAKKNPLKLNVDPTFYKCVVQDGGTSPSLKADYARPAAGRHCEARGAGGGI
jgi:hypothetical protein